MLQQSVSLTSVRPRSGPSSPPLITPGANPTMASDGEVFRDFVRVFSSSLTRAPIPSFSFLRLPLLILRWPPSREERVQHPAGEQYILAIACCCGYPRIYQGGGSGSHICVLWAMIGGIPEESRRREAVENQLSGARERFVATVRQNPARRVAAGKPPSERL